MKQYRFVTLLGLILIMAPSIPAQDRGAWTPASSNARAITGDLVIADAKLTIDFLLFPLAQIRSLNAAELTAAFDAEPGGSGNLYRVNITGGQRFQHKNTLCGSEDTQWMATYVRGKSLHIAFFSGSNPPVLTFESLNNSQDLCGSFAYIR